MNKIRLLSCATVLLNSLTSHATTGQKEVIPQNTIYQSCGHSLYIQDAVTNSAAYLSASVEEKQDLLENEFNNQRRKCYGKDLAKISATIIPFTFFTYKLYQKVGGNSAPMMGVGGAFMMYGLFGSVFGSIFTDFTTYLRNKVDAAKSISMSLVSPSNSDPIEKYEIRYVRQKPNIDKRLQDILEENFISARVGESGMEQSYFGLKKEGGKSPVDFAKAVLALPTSKAKVTYDPKRIDEHLGSFEPEILAQFKRFAVRHAAASTGKTVKKIVAYFKGPPGVGKTLAAEKIAETMQVPFWVIKLGGMTVEDLIGTTEKPGLLLEAILKAKYLDKNAKNPLILLDELDRALGMAPATNHHPGQFAQYAGMGGGMRGESNLLTALLTIIEPSTSTFFFPYLGIDFDISGVGFIGAGNFDITDEALASRFELMEFAGYSADFKLGVVKSRLFTDLLSPHKTSELPILETDFDDSDWERISHAIRADKDPGFRNIIQFIENYLGDKVLCKHYDDCPKAWSKPIKKPSGAASNFSKINVTSGFPDLEFAQQCL